MYAYQRKQYQTEIKDLEKQLEGDTVQHIEEMEAADNRVFFSTAGHGYLLIRPTDPGYKLAKKIVNFGHKGRSGIYLEEDCEAPEFIRIMKGGRK